MTDANLAGLAACGLDFGTSNTTLGLTGGLAGDDPALIALEDDQETLPSAIFFGARERGARQDPAPLIGRAAIKAYTAGENGRLMRALKSILGTDLIDQDTLLDGRRIAFREVLVQLLAEIKRRGEKAAGRPLDAVVHGRPVHFVDGDDEGDARAENALANIARAVGFRHVTFQYEPIAAALDYERQVNGEEIALIADIGGGTSDFSVVRIGPARRQRAERGEDILANGGVRIGGTDFDRLLSLNAFMPHLGYRSPMKKRGLNAPNGYFTDLATWSKINFLYTPAIMNQLVQVERESAAPHLIARLIRVIEDHAGHRLAMMAERAKIRLVETGAVKAPLDWIEKDLAATMNQAGFEAATAELADRIGAATREAVRESGLAAGQIDAVFLTGGSTLLPNVRRAILAALPEARVVDGDRFGSVGLGLTLEAARRYR